MGDTPAYTHRMLAAWPAGVVIRVPAEVRDQLAAVAEAEEG